MIEKIVSYLSIHPKRAFAIDAAGALVSAIFLGFIMPAMQSIFGLPPGICLILAVFPLIFFVYDILVLILVRQFWESWLKIIAGLNFAYTLLSLVIIYLHFNVLTGLGLAYFIGEILIVIVLASVEWLVAMRLKKSGEAPLPHRN